jgi:hypothetical protein
LEAALGVEDVIRFLAKKAKKQRVRKSQLPVNKLSRTINRVKAIHFSEDRGLAKTMTKVDIDKMITIKDKMKTAQRDDMWDLKMVDDFHNSLKVH